MDMILKPDLILDVLVMTLCDLNTGRKERASRNAFASIEKFRSVFLFSRFFFYGDASL